MKQTKKETITYWEYLKLDRLLDLQGGLEGDDDKVSEDEMHFIIVHQVFELWFKLVIKELRLIIAGMSAPKVDEDTLPFIVRHLGRINTILQAAVKHFDVMETLTPRDFLAFRAKLGTASGFQSFQMREIELLLGLDAAEREAHGHGDPTGYIVGAAGKSKQGRHIGERIKRAGEGPSLRDTIHSWLYRTPIQGSAPGDPGDEKIVRAFLDNYLAAVEQQNEKQIRQLIRDGSDETTVRQRFETAAQQVKQFLFAGDIEDKGEQDKVRRLRAGALFIESYRELPLLAWPRLLLDTVVELEELFTIFRFRHARMVERIIGRRVGTGGSAGVDYLDTTTRYRIFKELWAVRTLLLPGEALPELENPEFFGFSIDDSPRGA